jgi:hypothetical protein
VLVPEFQGDVKPRIFAALMESRKDRLRRKMGAALFMLNYEFNVKHG